MINAIRQWITDRLTGRAAVRPFATRHAPSPAATGRGSVGERDSHELPLDELLDPRALTRVGLLELISRTVVDGVMSGKHRSTHKGGSCEFSDHRPYAHGDDLRLIDWRVYGKRDRYYVKQFDDETNLQAWFVVDGSGSMAFGASTPSKFDYARMACACLGRLLLQQRDSIGLVMQADSQTHFLRPQVRSTHFGAVCEALRRATPAGNHIVSEQLDRLASSLKRRGLVIVLSDCFGDIDRFTAPLRQLRSRGNDVVVLQILAPEEVDFRFRSSAIFMDLENKGFRLPVTPGAMRRSYLERFGTFMKRLEDSLKRADVELVTITTDRDLGDALAYFLHRRAKNKRPIPRRAVH